MTTEPAVALDLALQRIAQTESSLHAWVRVDAAGAREQSVRVATNAPLRGEVVGIKDIIDVAGMSTRCGQPIETAAAARDALVVERLRAAGAVILGKTQTTPYAWLDPAVTRNPHDLERTPGGSSAGSAAAVAAGHCSLAIGSQTAGSTLRPASFCGVAGYKPTFGRVAVTGIMPLAASLDHVGIFARHARDVARAATVLDPSLGVVRYADAARSILLDDVALEHIPRDDVPLDDVAHYSAIEPASRAAIAYAAGALRASGCTITPARLPAAVHRGGELLATVVAFEAAAAHGATWRALGAALPPHLAELLRAGTATSAAAHAAALAEREALRPVIANIFERAPILLTVSALGEAPARASTGDARFVRPWTFFGLPAIAIPVCSGPHRLPISVQLVAPLGADATLLATAELLESACTTTPVRQPRGRAASAITKAVRLV